MLSAARTLGLSICLTILALPLSAAQTEDADVPKLQVRFYDLNLNAPADVEKLYRRISYAASRVCSNHGSRGLTARAQHLKCKRESIDRAIKAINRSRLTEYHLAHASAATRKPS